MKKVNELDRAQLKQDFKNMYKEIGLLESYQVLYELLLSVNVLFEVIDEKSKEELNGK